jgi:phosphoribosylformylglycinamidine synthase
MGIVVVDVMLKSEILDPQGQAVAGALPRLGFNQFTDVRQGKRFELTVRGEVTDEVLAAARHAAETMLSNPVIEDVVGVRAQSVEAGSAEAGSQAAGLNETAEHV